MAGPLHNLDWLRARLHFTGPDCLIWPFAKARGYGQVGIGKNKIKKAHRLMCEWVNGPPPTDKHEAAHTCGNGHLGCVHPQHLTWKTRTENHQDAMDAGTAYLNARGKPRAKLTAQQASEIKALKGFSVPGQTSIKVWCQPFDGSKNSPWRTMENYRVSGSRVSSPNPKETKP